MLDAGMGATHINKFLTGLGVPPLSPCTIKKREREIGPMVEALAKESCQATREYKMLVLRQPRTLGCTTHQFTDTLHNRDSHSQTSSA